MFGCASSLPSKVSGSAGARLARKAGPLWRRPGISNTDVRRGARRQTSNDHTLCRARLPMIRMVGSAEDARRMSLCS